MAPIIAGEMISGMTSGRHLPFTRLCNFRDLGGYPAGDGRVTRWRTLYRADSLGRLSGEEDQRRFRGLGIGTVIDLRYPWEIADKGRLPPADGVTWVNLSIEHRPYDQADIDPDLDPWRYLADRYAEVAADGTAELRRAIETIATADAPVVFHCASGKDRTGLLAALVLALIDVPVATIAEDFALTELATATLRERWHADNPGRELRWPGYGRAPAEIIQVVLAELVAEHGSIHRYASERLGLDDDVLALLRARLLMSS
jgi:protein-tyrosine phosphatase